MSPPLPCPKRTRVATAPCGAGAPWASLPEDLVQLIGWRVLSGDLLDYVRFRAVCAHWSRSATRPGGRGLLDPRFHPRRWMMLPEGHGLYPGHPALRGHVRFLNLSMGALARLHLPLFHDHVLLGCTDGLLLLLRHRDPGDTAVRLLHPFTGDVAELPPLSSLLPQIAEHYGSMTEDRKLNTLRSFLSGVSAAVTVGPAAGAITIVLVLETKLLVAHATTGDQQWTLSAARLPCLLCPTVSFHGNLYAVTLKSLQSNSVCIWQIDPPQLDAAEGRSLLPPRIIAQCPLVATRGAVNLVECGLELMLVGFNDANHTDLVLYRAADLISGRVVPITNIGEHALFLGERSLYASQNKGLPSVVANSITCSYRVTKNNPLRGVRPLRITEQYHLGTGTWSPAFDGDISCWNRPPASPYMLIHHIFTCCYHAYWSKGLIFHNKIEPDWSVKPNLWMYVIGWDPRATSARAFANRLEPACCSEFCLLLRRTSSCPSLAPPFVYSVSRTPSPIAAARSTAAGAARAAAAAARAGHGFDGAHEGSREAATGMTASGNVRTSAGDGGGSSSTSRPQWRRRAVPVLRLASSA